MSSESSKVLYDAGQVWRSARDLMKVAKSCISPEEHRALKSEVNVKARAALVVVDDGLDASQDAPASAFDRNGYVALEDLHDVLDEINSTSTDEGIPIAPMPPGLQEDEPENLKIVSVS